MSFASKRPAVAVAACLLPLACVAQGADTVPRLDDIVVTASRSTELQKDVIGDVTVIDRQALQESGQESLAEILSRTHDVQFAASGGPKTQTSVTLRGTNPQHTLVLIDGVRINSPATGAVNWNAIDPSIVERVEVLRGAASSLYGSDAIGGVVNIITRKGGQGRPTQAWGNVGAGSYETFKSSAGVSGSGQGWDYALSAAMGSSGGFNATNRLNRFGEYNPDSDGYHDHSLTGSLGYQWKPGHELRLTAFDAYVNADFDSGQNAETPWGSMIVHPAVSFTRQQLYTATATDDVTDSWQSVLRFGFAQENGESRTGSDSYKFGSLQRSYSWQNNFQLTPDHRLSAILERLEERPSSAGNFSVNRRDTNAAGIVYRGDMGAHHLQASVRNDDITGYGNRVTGGLGYDFDIDERWTVGASADTGFRAPTFSDLYGPNFIMGMPGVPDFYTNPDLRPEKSRNIELRVRYTADATRLGATVYQNKVTDLIANSICFGYDASGLCARQRPENIDRATIRGISLFAEQDYGNTTLSAGADFLDPRNDEPRAGVTGSQLPRRARQVYRLGAVHRIDGLRLGAEYQFTGARYDDAANSVRLGGYSLVNLTAAYDFSSKVGAQLRWNNVFDKQFMNAYGYNTAGSNVFLNLSWKM